MTTIYSVHDALTHEIVMTATTDNLKTRILTLTSEKGETRRFYVHNGMGVVAALVHKWKLDELPRDRFMKHDEKAREMRKAQDLINDKRN